MYKSIQEYREYLGTSKPYTFSGVFSPFFLIFTWDHDRHPLRLISVTKENFSFMIVHEDDYNAINIEQFEKYFSGKITIPQLEEIYNSWEQRTGALYKEMVAVDLAQLNEAQLLDCVAKLYKLMQEMSRTTLYIENIDYDKILTIVGHENKEKLDIIWDRAIETTFESFDARRLKVMLDIVKSGSTNSVREAKYIFTDYYWTKPEKEIKDALEELKNNYDQKHGEYGQKAIEIGEKQQQYNSWFAEADEFSKQIAQYVQLIMRLRDYRKDPISQIHAMMAEISTVLLQKAELGSKLAPYILFEEYLKGLDFIKSQKEQITQRLTGAIYLTNLDHTYSVELCDFDIAHKEAQTISEHETENITEIKGQIACKGKVTGTVRIVLDPHNAPDFQEGDILVASMTRPEFVPLMKKAAGIITNEGGITCHAAIVSRELNIPCIIGTKIALQVLKDGDLVEVDANNGIVKIIKA